MNTMFMEQDTLAAVSNLIERRMGLHFPSERHDALARGLERGGAEMGFADPGAYAVRLLATGITPAEQDTLAQALTVGETYFFREPAALKALEEHVLPALIAARSKSGERRIRMWSAGCCTGEEAYTLAIMLARLIPSLTAWDITILATDINPDFLRKARSGRYREWSFRGAPAWLKTGFFSKCASDEYELTARVRQMVSFSYLNLVDDAFPSLVNNTSAMDVILCRNVMMYFAPNRAKRVVGRFHRALLDGGWLVMSPSEGCSGSADLFTRASFDNATLYQKGAPVPLVSEPNFQRSTSKHLTAPPTFVPVTPAPEVPVETPLTAATNAYAQANYEAVLKIAALPEPAVAVIVLAARAAANLGRLDEALTWCQTALERDKLQASVHHLQATVLMAKRNEPAALASLKRVLYLDPHSVLAHFTTANLLLQTGDPARAMKYFRKTLTLLNTLDDLAVVPDSDGMTAEKLKVIVKHLQESLART
ncbi:MAG: CheR family methyltransferase [Kiritimatiellia bacterium]